MPDCHTGFLDCSAWFWNQKRTRPLEHLVGRIPKVSDQAASQLEPFPIGDQGSMKA